MSDPRNVGCLQARKSLVKLSKARFPSGISLFDDTKKQSKTMGAKPEKKSYYPSRTQNTTIWWLKNDDMYCSTNTQKSFLFEKSFSFDFLKA